MTAQTCWLVRWNFSWETGETATGWPSWNTSDSSSSSSSSVCSATNGVLDWNKVLLPSSGSSQHKCRIDGWCCHQYEVPLYTLPCDSFIHLCVPVLLENRWLFHATAIEVFIRNAEQGGFGWCSFLTRQICLKRLCNVCLAGLSRNNTCASHLRLYNVNHWLQRLHTTKTI